MTIDRGRLAAPRAREEVAFRGPPSGERDRVGVVRVEQRVGHLYALNRGILLTPFHNMARMAPTTTEADVDRRTEAFAAAVGELVAPG